MTWMEFASAIIDNIFSWPVAALLIVLILRKQLADLLGTAESLVLEAGGTRVSFTRQLERAREGVTEAKLATEEIVIDEIPPPFEESVPYVLQQYEFLSELAGDDPSFAIELAWQRLVAEPTGRLAHASGLPPANDTMRQLVELTSRGIVPHVIFRSAQYLNNLRMQVALAKMSPSPIQAREYAEVAREVAEYLHSLLEEESQPRARE